MKKRKPTNTYCYVYFSFVTYLLSFSVFNGPEHSYNAMYTVVFKLTLTSWK